MECHSNLTEFLHMLPFLLAVACFGAVGVIRALRATRSE